MVETILIPFSTWLLDKVGESAVSIITQSIELDKVDKKLKKAIRDTSRTLQKKYTEILGGNINDFFGKGEMYGALYVSSPLISATVI